MWRSGSLLLLSEKRRAESMKIVSELFGYLGCVILPLVLIAAIFLPGKRLRKPYVEAE